MKGINTAQEQKAGQFPDQIGLSVKIPRFLILLKLLRKASKPLKRLR